MGARLLIPRVTHPPPRRPAHAQVHGVFGAGKTHLIVVLILFLCAVFEKYEARMAAEEHAVSSSASEDGEAVSEVLSAGPPRGTGTGFVA